MILHHVFAVKTNIISVNSILPYFKKNNHTQWYKTINTKPKKTNIIISSLSVWEIVVLVVAVVILLVVHYLTMTIILNKALSLL